MAQAKKTGKKLSNVFFKAIYSSPLKRAKKTAEEIAKELDMTVNDVRESMKNSGRHLSMDAPLVEEKIQTFTMYCVQVNHQTLTEN